MPIAVSTITAPMPSAMIAAWPVLRTDSEICDWIEAREIFLHRVVEAPRLMRFIVEIFHRLEIEQAVHRLGVGVGVGLVHLAAELDAPAGDREGEPDIGDHHRPMVTSATQTFSFISMMTL